MANPVLLWVPLRDGLTGQNRAGEVAATATGPTRFAADGYVAETGTTNEFFNPEAIATTFWTKSAGTTLTAITDDGAGVSTTSIQFTATDAAQGARSNKSSQVAPQANPTLARTFSFDARAVSGSAVWEVYAVEFSAADAVLNSTAVGTVTLIPTWACYAATYTPISGSVAYVVFGIRRPTGAAADLSVMRVDHVQIEQQTFATSYADGSMGTGYAWISTAHASASTRAATALSVEAGVAPASVALRYTPDDGDEAFAYLTGPGAIGPYGTLALAGSVLTLTSSRRTAFSDLLAFDRELTVDEQAALQASPAWSFAALQPRIGGLSRIGPSLSLALARTPGEL